MNSVPVSKCVKVYDRLKSQRLAAKELGISRSALRRALKIAEIGHFTSKTPKKSRVVKTPKRHTKRFIFSSAQNNTEVHEGFLNNLRAYADFLECTLHIAGFTYNKSLFEDHRKNSASQVYHASVVPFLADQQFDLGDNLMFCGNMNTLPTAVTPLSGFETYTRQKWGIFPHAKVQLVSVPTMKHSPAKQIMTTGAVTLPNYVQKRAGIRAHFHHVLGAVLVEIDSKGRQFCRHLLADDDGSFQDLTRIVSNGVVTDGHAVEAINWGDIHFESMSDEVCWGAFGFLPGGQPNHNTTISMLDWLKPKYQFFHDITDFKARNHHSLNDPHHRFRMHNAGDDNVSQMFIDIGMFLGDTSRSWCQSVVVESNHDKAALRWLKEGDWKNDPVNAQFYLAGNLAALNAIQAGDKRFSVLEWAVGGFVDSYKVKFLREDDSFKICDDQIECGIHGHNGANGARGAPKQFTKMGPKANTGHTHSPGIIDGIYTAGTSSDLDLGYNVGLSSWSHAHIVSYKNGKRIIITMQDGLFCAE